MTQQLSSENCTLSRIPTHPYSWGINNWQHFTEVKLFIILLSTLRTAIRVLFDAEVVARRYLLRRFAAYDAGHFGCIISGKNLDVITLFILDEAFSFRDYPQCKVRSGTEVVLIRKFLPNFKHLPQLDVHIRLPLHVIEHTTQEWITVKLQS